MISPKEAYRIAVETVKPKFKPVAHCYEYKGCYAFPLVGKNGETLLDMFAFVDVDTGDVYPCDPVLDYNKLVTSKKIQIGSDDYAVGKERVLGLLPKTGS